MREIVSLGIGPSIIPLTTNTIHNIDPLSLY